MQRVLEPEVMDTVEEAVEYDRMDHSEPNAAFVERLVELGARGRMLDIGTGPGHIPFLVCAADPEAEVVGIDLSQNMLRLAEEKRAASPHRSRVEFRTADAKGLDFPNDSFDTVFSNTILHHIPDPRTLLAEAARVLRPGGVLLIRDLMRPEDEERVSQLVGKHAQEASPEQRELFRASLCAALTAEELRAQADEVGLDRAEVVIDSDRHQSLQIRRPG